MVNPRFGGYAFNKLYRADIIKGNKLRYLDGIKMLEDLPFCMQYLQSAPGGVAITDQVLYHYTMRKSSILHSMTYEIAKDMLIAYDIVSAVYESNPAFKDYLSIFAFQIHSGIASVTKKEYKNVYLTSRKAMKEFYNTIRGLDIPAKSKLIYAIRNRFFAFVLLYKRFRGYYGGLRN